VIVAIFTGNDFGDLLRNKMYRLEDGGRITKSAFTLSPELLRRMTVQRQEAILKRLLRNAGAAALSRLGWSNAPADRLGVMTPAERVEEFVHQHQSAYEEFVVRKDAVVQDPGFDTYDADVAVHPDAPAVLYKIALMDQLIGRMQEVVNATGARMLLVPIPNPADTGGHDTVAIDPSRYPQYRPRGRVEILEGIAQRRAIPVVDLFTPFDGRARELYFAGFDDHWNDRGQAVAAQIVADYVLAQKLLPASRGDRP
jgi:hypothetical protein